METRDTWLRVLSRLRTTVLTPGETVESATSRLSLGNTMTAKRVLVSRERIMIGDEKRRARIVIVVSAIGSNRKLLKRAVAGARADRPFTESWEELWLLVRSISLKPEELPEVAAPMLGESTRIIQFDDVVVEVTIGNYCSVLRQVIGNEDLSPYGNYDVV